jgi:quercetin dioxygenase-like cupin family protein
MTDGLIHDQLFFASAIASIAGATCSGSTSGAIRAGGVLTEHFHPALEEGYEVVEGELTFHQDGRPQVLRAGERSVVSAGVRHRSQNAGEGESGRCSAQTRRLPIEVRTAGKR